MAEEFETGPDGYPRYYNDCPFCQREKEHGNTFFPPHNPSTYCLSGKRPHCTCNYCF